MIAAAKFLVDLDPNRTRVLAAVDGELVEQVTPGLGEFRPPHTPNNSANGVLPSFRGCWAMSKSIA